jgi:hypothetical protein
LTTVHSTEKRGQVRILVTEDPQGDSDGVPDAIEDHAPFNNGGDGNGDAIADSQQSYVASFTTSQFTNTFRDRWVTLVASPGQNLLEVQGVPLPANSPPGVDFPVGFLSFEVVGLSEGEAATVTVYMHQQITQPTYYKYGLEPEDRPERLGMTQSLRIGTSSCSMALPALSLLTTMGTAWRTGLSCSSWTACAAIMTYGQTGLLPIQVDPAVSTRRQSSPASSSITTRCNPSY